MQHVDLAQGRWQTLTLPEQLGNAGSEFGRALAARQGGDQSRFENAAARFYELIGLTVADPRWQGRRRRELARVKEIGAGALYDNDQMAAASLEKYFFQFACLARTGHVRGK